ncbi:MAG: hypothetical protein KGS72_02700 [Cyanobacteria bacterium REEB67]|nr:hypothetical protein [Cyanobacteria bacterium REEB67]
MTQNNSHLQSATAEAVFDPTALEGARIKAAQSSLDSFVVFFEDGRGLMLKATADEEECGISAAVLDANQIEAAADAVCAVDWSWIYGQNVLPGGVRASRGMHPTVRLTLSGVGTITIAVALWQGKPFLSFMPYKKP